MINLLDNSLLNIFENIITTAKKAAATLVKQNNIRNTGRVQCMNDLLQQNSDIVCNGMIYWFLSMKKKFMNFNEINIIQITDELLHWCCCRIYSKKSTKFHLTLRKRRRGTQNKVKSWILLLFMSRYSYIYFIVTAKFFNIHIVNTV